VLGNMLDLGTASGPSDSLTDQGISLSDWHAVGGGETGSAVADPADPNVVYAGEYGGYVSRYDHRTRQAHNVSIYPFNPSGRGAAELRYRFQWTAPLMLSPHDPKTIYHAANVLFRSRDGGTTWEPISPDLTRNDPTKQQPSGGPITGDNTGAEVYCTIFAIAESPRKAGVLWAGSDDGLVHVSLDGGKRWDNVTRNLSGLPDWGTMSTIEASPHDAGTAYVVVHAYRLDDDRPYLWKTTDYGKTWTSLAKGLPQDAHLRVVREDPKVAGLLYVGNERGVSYSPDGGVSWRKLKMNLPTVLVSDLVVKDDDLVVGTHGRSVWILDDLTPVRQWAGKRAGGPHLFPVRPATRWRVGPENYAGADAVPGENPPRGAVIHYTLDKKPKGDLVLEVRDGQGKLVEKLTSKKEEPEVEADHPDAPSSPYEPTVLETEPGLHRVVWDLHAAGPTVIPKAKNDYGIPRRGPLVLPGKYTVKLRAEDREVTGTIEVRMDPRVKATLEELQERHRFAAQLHADITQLSETVIALRELREQLQGRAAAYKGRTKAEGWVKESKGLVKKLDTLEEKLHNPKAEVAYDILAMKGGAKLYSQLVPLYDAARESDGPVTQGMREVYAEHARELQTLVREWGALADGEVGRLNAAARELGLPTVTTGAGPERKDRDGAEK
jgi:molybdopterin converting factor small subunit